ncbi:MAG TPA: DUF4097 family beta strand repeat-containing protein [Candidatus Acidoferrales bacterium]|nr:DUF4097 family beta strand repeat-containing protein [Candidatus Acidoferrales bacterium]
MNNERKSRYSRHAIAALLAASSIFAAQSLHAQQTPDRISVPLSDPSRPATIHISLVNGGITVKAGDNTKEVVVEALVRGSRRERGDDSQGMHRVPISSTGLTVEQENNQVRISTESYARDIDVTITTPRQANLHLQAVNGGNIVIEGVDGEFDINNVNGHIDLNNVSGSAVAHALNGHLIASFSRVNGKPMAFSSLNGKIDVTFPADFKANVTIKCDQGNVYSDFDVALQNGAPQTVVEDSSKNGGKYRVRIDRAVHGTINGGGPEYQFTNFQGSVYIRKAGAAH